MTPQTPAHWPAAVRDTYAGALDETPDLTGAAFASLVESCELLAKAYALDDVAAAADHVARGSMGQDVLHPAVTEARLHRTAAAAILGRLIPARNKGQRVARARHGGIQ